MILAPAGAAGSTRSAAAVRRAEVATARKLKVNIDDLLMALDSGSGELDYCLDLEPGDVILVTDEEQSAAEEFLEEAGEAEDAELRTRFDQWIENYPCPDWQRDGIRTAVEIETDSGSRYAAIPGQDSREGYNDMADFADSITDERLQELLNVALNGRGAFRRFKDVLSDYPEERERWFKFRDERMRQRAMDWLKSIDIEPI